MNQNRIEDEIKIGNQKDMRASEKTNQKIAAMKPREMCKRDGNTQGLNEMADGKE